MSFIVWSLRKYRQPFNPDKLLQSLNNKDHKNTLLNKIHALEQERKEKEEVVPDSLPYSLQEMELNNKVVTEESTPNTGTT